MKASNAVNNRRELSRRLVIIRAGLGGFKTCVQALVDIRQGKLWEGSQPKGGGPAFDSWKDFVKRGLPAMTRQHRDRLRAAADTAGKLSPLVTVKPRNEWQLRELKDYPKAVTNTIWELACAISKSEGRDEPGNADVTQARDEVLADLAEKEKTAQEAAEEDAGDEEPETGEELAEKINHEEDKADAKLAKDKSPEAIQERATTKIVKHLQKAQEALPRLAKTPMLYQGQFAAVFVEAALRLVESSNDEVLCGSLGILVPKVKKALEWKGLRIAG